MRRSVHRLSRPTAAAQALREFLASLGPAAVKLGQAFSSRADVLPPAYARELALLQDRLPPFPDVRARAVLDSALAAKGCARGVFAEVSDSPIAAASLGQARLFHSAPSSQPRKYRLPVGLGTSETRSHAYALVSEYHFPCDL